MPDLNSQLSVHIRKACLILGLKIERLCEKDVITAWKKQVIECHPDGDGDPQTAVIINQAKDALLRWLLPGDDNHQDVRLPRQPQPDAGAGQVARSPLAAEKQISELED